ncbi:sugar kinase [Roseibaca sp. Y0-43]|uniref:sugar kinase n=1 Tax=Roseibaca sp. Y0-43 TaxID=2816854 RepID=UPI001D0CADC6|nr:sugar kinase [Roseibaca sp. Y0-43]MCC1482067.1 sugar kinase [Roseibaca sp. Y0-43]
MTRPRILCLGEAMVELAPVGDGLYRRGFAGDTFNTAWHMAQILGPRADVGFVTRVGQDSLSLAFIEECRAGGLDVGAISQSAERGMGLYMIALDGVERSFHYWRGQSAARCLADEPARLARDLAGAGLVHLTGISVAILTPDARDTLRKALCAAKARGALLSFDPNLRPALWQSLDDMRAVLPDFLALADILLPGFDDEAHAWGDADPQASLARLGQFGASEIVVKNAGGAVHMAHKGQGRVVQLPPVSGIRDTTGAGDAFNAGYLAARALGHGPERAIDWGHRMAGHVLRSAGARVQPDALGADRAGWPD